MGIAVPAVGAEPGVATLRGGRRRRLAELESATGITFGRYYRPGLIERLATLLDTLGYLPLVLRRVAATLAVSVTGWFVLFFRLTPWASVPALLWAIAGGLVVGALIAVRGVVRRGLGHASEVFDESLDVVAVILDDSTAVSASEKPPEWKDVVEGTLIAVVLPAIEVALRRRIGFLARPVVRMLNWALLGVAGKVNAEVEAAAPAAPQNAPSATLESLRASTTAARAILGRVASGAVATASLPLNALIVLAALVFGAPLALAAWIL
jgi:hypothetical protein